MGSLMNRIGLCMPAWSEGPGTQLTSISVCSARSNVSDLDAIELVDLFEIPLQQEKLFQGHLVSQIKAIQSS